MTAPQDGLESVAERARRALRDNEEAHLLDQRMVRGLPSDEPGGTSRQQQGQAVSPPPSEPAQARAAEPAQARVTEPAQARVTEPAQARVTEPAQARAAEPMQVNDGAQAAWGQEPFGVLEQLDQRMLAIHTVRELEPRRTCFRQRVQELSRRLAQTATDSVHYAQLLLQLTEAHAELSRLEGQVEMAQHLIRSTEWLMELLADPARA